MSDTTSKTATQLNAVTLVPDGTFSFREGVTVQSFRTAAAFANPSPEDLAELCAPAIKIGKSTVSVSHAEIYLERLRTLVGLLSSAPTAGAPLVRHLADTKSKIDVIFKKNLKAVFAGQRPLEKTWRALDLLYQLARRDANSGVPIKIANISGEDLAKDDQLFQQFAAQIPQASAYDLGNMIGLIVVPGALRKEAMLMKFGEMAVKTKSMVFTDFLDADFNTVKKQFEEGADFATIKGGDRWKQQVCLVGNSLRVRKNLPDEDLPNNPGLPDGLYVSAAALLAGKIIRGDDTTGLATAQSGDAHSVHINSADDSDVTLRWNLTDKSADTELFKDSIIYVTRRTGNKLTFWGVETLSNDDNFKQYTVVRVRDYIEKCLVEYMNTQAFTPNTPAGRRKLQEQIQQFLVRNSSDQDPTKMLRGGQVMKVKTALVAGKEQADELDIELELDFKVSLKKMNIEVKARLEGELWKLQDKQ